MDFMFSLLLVHLLCIASAFGEPCTWEEDKACASGRYVEALVGAVYNPGLEYGIASGKHLSKSTQAGIVNAAGKWVMRMDLPHKGVKYPHININKALTGMKDPHIPVPEALVHFASTAGSAAKRVADGAGYAAFVVEGVRLMAAESKDKPKVVASMAGGYAGAYGGAYVGSTAGAWIGGAIGSVFGGVGAVPGAAVGSMFVGFLGSMTGSVIGSEISSSVFEMHNDLETKNRMRISYQI